MAVIYNPLDPEVHADPYPHYRQLREEDPVHRSPLGFWVVSRYSDVASLVRDHRLGHEVDVSMDGASMLFRDPPAHTRLRSLVSKAFTPRMLERLRSRIRTIVDESLVRAREAEEMDVIADLAFPLPATVISEMLGLPVEDHARCRRWAGALTRTLDPVLSDEDASEIAAASIEFDAYLSEQVAARRSRPGDDLLTALLAAEQEGDRLSPYELLSTVSLLFVAGHETTTNLIGNGFLALLRNPDQLRRLREDPRLLRSGIEELLRYDSPVQFLIRTVKEPVTVGDRRLERGDPALLLIAAANRDPDEFRDPDVLDVGRPDARHLSFGGGIHFCLGSALARMEGQIAIGALVSMFDDFAFDPAALRWREHINLRGLVSLPVRAS
ncbi:MAG TPA: cytochrome P450 [Actinomycetota bacterium]|nr:cytochrome P450 [Actinomycetota bacterium]